MACCSQGTRSRPLYPSLGSSRRQCSRWRLSLCSEVHGIGQRSVYISRSDPCKDPRPFFFPLSSFVFVCFCFFFCLVFFVVFFSFCFFFFFLCFFPFFVFVFFFSLWTPLYFSSRQPISPGCNSRFFFGGPEPLTPQSDESSANAGLLRRLHWTVEPPVDSYKTRTDSDVICSDLCGGHFVL